MMIPSSTILCSPSLSYETPIVGIQRFQYFANQSKTAKRGVMNGDMVFENIIDTTTTANK